MLIRGGTAVTPESVVAADVSVRGEQIAEVGPALTPVDGEEVVEASGLVVLPGVIDPHTHFDVDRSGPTSDDWDSGTASAAAGGVTTCINFAIQHPSQSFEQALAAVRSGADAGARIDYSLHLNITRLDPGWEAELERVVDGGVTSAKVYTTYRGTVFYVDDWTIYRLMERSGGAGLLVQMHAENDDMLQGRRRELVAAGQVGVEFHSESRPAAAESEAVARGLFMARTTGSPIYFVHLSSPLSVDLVHEARERGILAFAETCPHFLCLDDSVYRGPDASRFLMTPPIRSKDVRAALWQRVARGLIDSVGSDHCGYSLAQRGRISAFTEVENPGIPGVETTLPLLYSFGVTPGHMDLRGLARMTSEGPARIFGLWPKKGRLAAGADADLALLDPSAAGPLTDGELHTGAGFSPFSGLDLAGRVRMTISRGRVVYDRGRVLGEPGRGRYVARLPFDFTSP